MIATIALCSTNDAEFREMALKLLKVPQENLPATESIIKRLHLIMDEPNQDMIEEALNLHPFNYH